MSEAGEPRTPISPSEFAHKNAYQDQAFATMPEALSLIRSLDKVSMSKEEVEALVLTFTADQAQRGVSKPAEADAKIVARMNYDFYVPGYVSIQIKGYDNGYVDILLIPKS